MNVVPSCHIILAQRSEINRIGIMWKQWQLKRLSTENKVRKDSVCEGIQYRKIE